MDERETWEKASAILQEIQTNRPASRPLDADLQMRPIGSFAHDAPDVHESFRCWPEDLPDGGYSEALEAFEGYLRAIAYVWRSCPARPRPTADHIQRWRELIAQWVEDESLPLLIRKGGLSGVPFLHATDRSIILTDNSPAQWAYAGAILGEPPTLAGVRAALANRTLPVAQIFTKAESAAQKAYLAANPNALLGGPLGKSQHGDMNRYVDGNAYKLAHIDAIGLNSRSSADQIPIENLKAHTSAFLDPGNMFVVPKAFAGVAEASAFCRLFEGNDASARRRPESDALA